MKRVVLLLAAAAIAWAVWYGLTARAPHPTTPAGALPPPPHGQATAITPLGGGDLAVGAASGGISIRAPDGAVRFRWVAHAGPVRRLIPRGDTLYSVGADGSVAQWRISGELLGRLRLSDHALNDGSITGGVVVAADRGAVGRLDDPRWLARGAHGRAAFAVAASPDGREALTGGADGTLRRWAVDDGAEIARYPLGDGWITALHWDPRRRLAALSDGRLLVWTTDADAPTHTLTVPGGAITALAVEGDRALCGSEDGRARLVDLTTAAVTATLDPGDVVAGPTTAVALSAERAYTGGRDDRIRVWRVTDGAPVATLRAIGEPLDDRH